MAGRPKSTIIDVDPTNHNSSGERGKMMPGSVAKKYQREFRCCPVLW